MKFSLSIFLNALNKQNTINNAVTGKTTALDRWPQWALLCLAKANFKCFILLNLKYQIPIEGRQTLDPLYFM